MTKPSQSSKGLFGSLRRLLETALATVENRIELIGVELQEERLRLVELLVGVATVIALGLMTLAFMALTLVILFWENGRVPALITLSLTFLVATIAVWRTLKSRLQNAPKPFAATLVEIKKDGEWLATKG